MNFIIKIKNSIKIFKYIKKSHLTLLFSIYILTSFFEVLGVISIFPFMTLVLDSQLIYENETLQNIYNYFNFESEKQFIFFTGIFFMMSFILSSSFLIFSNYITFKITHLYQLNFISILINKYFDSHQNTALRTDKNKIIRNIIQEVVNLRRAVLIPFLMIFGKIISIIIIIFILYKIIGFYVLLILSGVFFVYFLLSSLVLYLTGEYDKKSYDLRGFSLNSLIKLTNTYKQIKILGKQKENIKEFFKSNKELVKMEINLNIINFFPKFLLETILVLCLVSFIIINYNSIQSSFIVLTTGCLYGFYRLIPAAQVIYQNIVLFNTNYYSFEKTFADLKSVNKIKNAIDEKAFKLKFDKYLELRNLNVSYFDRDKEIKIFNDLNYKFFKGKKYAIIGPNGTGKSTLLDIICGFLTPQSGSIYLDDKKINFQNDLKNYHQNLFFSPQENYILPQSIKSNITFEENDSQIDLEHLKYSIAKSELTDFIKDVLKNDINTVLSEENMKLSGGFNQRLFFSRAIYFNKDLLLLDEPFSAIDKKNKENILNFLSKEYKKTIIMITHDKQDLKFFDYVLEIKNSKLFESKNEK